MSTLDKVCSIEIRIREHHWHIRLYPEKSVMAEHTINLGNCIQFNDISIMTKKSGRMEMFH